MDSNSAQVALLWLAVALYAASTVLFSAAAVFRRNGRWLSRALALAALGLAPHAAAIAVRWLEVGHGPYVSFYEVASSDTWVAVALFVLVGWRVPTLRTAGIAVLPVSFLLIGAAVLSPREGRELLPILRSFWLVLHVLFAKLAYGPYVLGLGAAVAYLWAARTEAGGSGPAFLGNRAVLDELSYRLVAFGFLMHAIMVIAGAIWANQAWGSYWSWDPIETWSLVSWLAFAAVLHLRIVHNWAGARAAVATIGAVAVVLFAFFGIPFLGGSHRVLIGA